MILLALALFAAPVEIALTFDDLPSHGPWRGAEHVRIAHDILAALKKHRVPQAYGFVNGARLDAHPELKAVLDQWRAAGYPLGNHGYSHLNPNQTPLAQYLADIERNEATLAGFGPASAWKVFRYPFLFEGDSPQRRAETIAWLRDRGYRKADVTIDFDDWAWDPPWARCAQERDEIALGELRHTYLDAAIRLLGRYRELGRAIAGREIAHVLLLHVGAPDADQMDALLSTYEAAGARWVTLEQAEADPVFAQDPGFVTPWGWTLLDRLAKGRNIRLASEWWPDEKRLDQVCRQ